MTNEMRAIQLQPRLRRTIEERAALGKSLRQRAPRTSHAEWSAGSARADPIGLIEDQNKERLDWLVPLRRRRMMASPFAFFRGGARIMAVWQTDFATRYMKCGGRVRSPEADGASWRRTDTCRFRGTDVLNRLNKNTQTSSRHAPSGSCPNAIRAHETEQRRLPIRGYLPHHQVTSAHS
jgi:hypothetical protein